MPKQKIIEGTPAWERICEQCGMCCLIKYCDKLGNIYLTNVRCAALDKDTRKCKCYAADMNARDNGSDNCIALGGVPVTRETLNNGYPVPSFCPYAQKFCNNDAAKKPKHRPDIDWAKTISETEMADGDSVAKHIIIGSSKYFKYNPEINKKIHDAMKSIGR